VAVAVGASVIGDAMLYAVLPANIESFGLQVGLVGVILSANRFIRLASNTWAARVYDRIGVFWPFMLALSVGGAITAGYGLVHGFWALLLLRLLWGVCFSFLRLGGYLAVLRGRPPERGWLMGLLNTGFRAGQVAGSLLGAVLADALGIPIAFPVLAIVTGLSVVGMLRTARTPEERMVTSEAANAPRLRLGFVGPNLRHTIWNVLISHVPEMAHSVRVRLLAVNLTGFAVAFGLGGLLTGTLGYILKELVGAELHFGSLVVGVTSVTGVLLALRYSSDLGLSALMGRLTDTWGRGKLLGLALPILLIGLLVTGFVRTPLPFLLVLPAIFVAMTGAVVALDASAGDIAVRARAAQVMSRYATWRDLGSALGPLLGFALVSLAGLPWMFVLATALLFASAIVYWAAMRNPVPAGT